MDGSRVWMTVESKLIEHVGPDEKLATAGCMEADSGGRQYRRSAEEWSWCA